MSRPSGWLNHLQHSHPAAFWVLIAVCLWLFVWITNPDNHFGRVQVRENVPAHLIQRKLSELAAAMHKAAGDSEDGGTLPTDICDEQGRPLLSWRVKLLLYLKQDALYHRFRRDEPWDSSHNKALAGKTPEVFQVPGVKPPAGHTYCKVFTGPGGWFGKPGQATLNRVPDGSGNTILIVAGGDPVPWSKPADIPYYPDRPLPNLTLPGRPDYIHVVMGDGSMRFVSLKTVSEKSIRAAITWNANDTVGPDW